MTKLYRCNTCDKEADEPGFTEDIKVRMHYVNKAGEKNVCIINTHFCSHYCLIEFVKSGGMKEPLEMMLTDMEKDLRKET